MGNNPMLMIDPNGMRSGDFWKKVGKFFKTGTWERTTSDGSHPITEWVDVFGSIGIWASDLFGSIGDWASGYFLASDGTSSCGLAGSYSFNGGGSESQSYSIASSSSGSHSGGGGFDTGSYYYASNHHGPSPGVPPDEPDPPSGQGGEPLPLWMGLANNGVNAAAYGAYEVGGTYRLMKSGSLSLGWYKSGWSTGNQYVKSTYSLSKLGKGVGLGTSFLGVVMGGYSFAVSDKSWGDYGQLGVSITSSVLTCYPATTPLGIGIGAIDLAGGFNGFYQGLDANQQLYKTTGGVIFPINGIPTYIQLKK